MEKAIFFLIFFLTAFAVQAQQSPPDDCSGQLDSVQGCPGYKFVYVKFKDTTTGVNRTYVWGGGEITDTILITQSGLYSVTVEDHTHGCTGYFSKYITVDSVPSGHCSGKAIGTPACDGSVTISFEGKSGFVPDFYKWINTGDTTPTIKVYTPMDISVEVSSLCCTGYFHLEVTSIPTPLGIGWIDALNPSCGKANGEIYFVPVGGVLPLTYLWNNGATGNFVSGLAPGTYNCTVTDSLGCTATSGDVILYNVGMPSDTTYSYKDVCFGGSSVPNTWPNQFGCDSVHVSVEINQSLNLVNFAISDDKCQKANGSINVGVAGNGTLSYLWSNGATTQTITGLSEGVYGVTVTNNFGCSVEYSGLVGNYGFPSTQVGVKSKGTCNPDSLGSFFPMQTVNNYGCDSFYNIVIDFVFPTPPTQVFYDSTCSVLDTVTTYQTYFDMNGCPGTEITMRPLYQKPPTKVFVDSLCGLTKIDTLYGTYVDAIKGCIGDSISYIFPKAKAVDISMQDSTCNPIEVGVDTAFYTAPNGCPGKILTTVTLKAIPPDKVTNSNTCDPTMVGTFFTTYSYYPGGCLGNVTNVVTLLPSTSTNVMKVTCNSAMAGNTTVKLPAANGCDSVVNFITTFVPIAETKVFFYTCFLQDIGEETKNFVVGGDGCDSTVVYITTLDPQCVDCKVQVVYATGNAINVRIAEGVGEEITDVQFMIFNTSGARVLEGVIDVNVFYDINIGSLEDHQAYNLWITAMVNGKKKILYFKDPSSGVLNSAVYRFVKL